MQLLGIRKGRSHRMQWQRGQVKETARWQWDVQRAVIGLLAAMPGLVRSAGGRWRWWELMGWDCGWDVDGAAAAWTGDAGQREIPAVHGSVVAGLVEGG
jgi:hypothetical protein